MQASFSSTSKLTGCKQQNWQAISHKKKKTKEKLKSRVRGLGKQRCQAPLLNRNMQDKYLLVLCHGSPLISICTKTWVSPESLDRAVQAHGYLPCKSDALKSVHIVQNWENLCVKRATATKPKDKDLQTGHIQLSANHKSRLDIHQTVNYYRHIDLIFWNKQNNTSPTGFHLKPALISCHHSTYHD